jgi:hypothetical protein
MTALSASGLARAAACPPAFALPAVARDSKDAARGRGVHAFLEAIAGGTDRDAALVATPPALRELCAAIDVRQVPRGEPEVAFAYDVSTGRARRTGARSRGYDAGAAEIHGTADLIAGDVVIDWKTVSQALDVEIARPQLEFYALCLARSDRLPLVHWRIGVIAENGALGWHDGRLDWEQMNDVAAGLRRTWARVMLEREARTAQGAGYIPDLVAEGPWCRYCAAWDGCPAKRGVVRLMVEGKGDLLAAEQAADALLMARDAETAAERVRRVVGELVDREGEIEATDGRRVRRDARGALRVFPARAAGAGAGG